MAVIHDDFDALVESASEDDLAEVIQIELSEAKVSLDDLRSQAANDDFQSDRAERAWYVIERLVDRH